MKCITDKIQDKTDLQTFYPSVTNVPPLLICNQNKHERYKQSLLDNSVLLQGENVNSSSLNRNQNDSIYQRNLSSQPLHVNIDMRPVSSSHCASSRFVQERDELEKYNKYQPTIKCEEVVFQPGRGAVKTFFDNIDVDSELKNINQIDTRCSERLYKIDPNDKQTKLSCYSNTLVKDYELLERNLLNRNIEQCSKLESFPKCDSQTVKCVNPRSQWTVDDNMPSRAHGQSIISSDLSHHLQNTQERTNNIGTTLQQQEEQRITTLKADIQLLDAKRDITFNNRLNRHNNNNYQTDKQSEPIVQYKGNGATNIYAPIIRKQQVHKKDAYNLGKQAAYDIQLDIKLQERIKQLEEDQGLRPVGYNPTPKNLCSLTPVKEPEIFPFQCREQTKNLYKFNQLTNDSKDCYTCEQLFNNQTKRKHLNVNRVPEHILNQ